MQTIFSGVYCAHDLTDGPSVQRFIRYLDGGSIFEMIFNWGATAATYALEGRVVLKSHNGPFDTQASPVGNLKPYDQYIIIH